MTGRLPHPRWPRLLPDAWVVGLATLGPVGRRLPAPGTWGSLCGLLYFTVFFLRVGWLGTLGISLLAAWVAAAICGEAEIRLRSKDPGMVILDEFVVMPLCFLGWGRLQQLWPSWAVLVAGFLLFRLFDIAKPLGIRRLQSWPGGWGVVVDDVAAALAACASLHLLTHFLSWR